MSRQDKAAGTDGPSTGQFAGHRPGSSGYRGVLVGLAAAGVATFAQLYSLQGVLPELAANLHISASTAALTVSAATLGLAVAVIPWSAAADRFGRLPVMRMAILAAVLLGLAVPLSPSLPVLLGLRFLEGAALGGIPAVALAYLSEEVSRLHAAVAAGTYVSGTTVGGLAGRILAAPLAELVNWRVGVAAVSLLAAGAAAVFMVTAPRQHGFVPMRRSDPGHGLAARLVANLRSPRLLALYLQGFLLMGGFVAVYNYLGFRLVEPPFGLPSGLASSLFLAYLAGTWSSRAAGTLAVRLRGRRKPVLLLSIAAMAAGLALTLAENLPAVVSGLLVFTAGFFAAHSIASGWTPQLAYEGRAQASSLYNLFYYTGSSLLGWVGGYYFQQGGWPSLVLFVGVLLLAAAVVAVVVLRRNDDGGERTPSSSKVQ
ncbi:MULTISPECIES: MFS transporter [unclassified Arthrobacter]|uniref:MFS transporter n=1 Tax=unclassified Arthrobacter TaxID=235627 RepID=UPI0024DFBBDE|nr:MULTISPECIES: MFS transporter [unclassified Arthrobacter]MCC9144326.1 MFS transporter [Arthrobacter sp. zg-Y919]MDK1275552.1 MFS transporter [Arthrobacter sp. zg.Y919]WIB03074.1 MFS transporter [Arthrobacter sp. zg-Y919]